MVTRLSRKSFRSLSKRVAGKSGFRVVTKTSSSFTRKDPPKGFTRSRKGFLVRETTPRIFERKKGGGRGREIKGAEKARIRAEEAAKSGKISLSKFNKVARVKKPMTFKQFKKFQAKQEIARRQAAVGGQAILQEVEPPKSIGGKLRKLRSEQVSKRERELRKGKTFTGLARGTLVSALLGGASGVIGVGEAIAKPVQTAKGFVSAVSKPQQTATAIFKEFKKDPVAVAAEFAVYQKVVGLGGKAVRNSPVGQALRKESFIRSLPKGEQASARAILNSAKVQAKINPVKVKNIKKLDFVEVKTIPNKQFANALKKTLKQTDSQVFGSVSSRALSGKKTAIPKDIDLATANVGKFNKAFVKNLPKALKGKYKLKGEKIVDLKGNALLDVKPLSRLIPQKNILTGRGRLPITGKKTVLTKTKGSVLPQFKKRLVSGKFDVATGKAVKVEGIKLRGFGEQTTRKGLGTLQVLIEKNARRAKDPQAFVKSLDVQIAGLKKAKPKTALGRASNAAKVKKLTNARKILTSKDFQKLLEKKVPGITKEFPLLKKINIKKLKSKAARVKGKKIIKKIKKVTKKRKKVAKIGKKLVKKRRIVRKTAIKRRKLKKKVSTVKRTVAKKRRLKRTKRPIKRKVKRVSKRRPSKIPKRPRKSIIPIPRARPSKTPRSRLRRSKVPKSRVPKSKVPPSKVPPSKVPPSKVPPSKVPPSRVPASKVPRSVVPKSRIPALRAPKKPVLKFKPKQRKIRKKKKTKAFKKKKFKKREFTPTIAGIGKRAKRKTVKKRRFTGAEKRGRKK